MKTTAQNRATARPLSPLLLLRLALRDLRGGLHGFGIFLACIALGVAAITGVASLSRSLEAGLAAQGRVILGGDVAFETVQSEWTAPEEKFLRAHGQLSKAATLRAMARVADGKKGNGGEATLIEIKAVDGAYPLVGDVTIAPEQPLSEAFSERDGFAGIVADTELLTRLGLAIGDPVRIGDKLFILRGTLSHEPDHLAGGLGFGPRVLMSEAALRSTSLLAPGALVHWLYRLALSPSGSGPNTSVVDSRDLDQFVAETRAAFPQAGWEIRTRDNISPQFSRNLERFTQFLTLVGLTSLLIGGVGVANAIHGFVARKKPVIATLKALGAPGSAVFTLMLIEVMLITLLGTMIGGLAGSALPFAAPAVATLLPFPIEPGFYPAALGGGMVYGLLTALIFSLGPLGRAHDVPVAALFRDTIDTRPSWPRPRYLLFTSVAAAILISLLFLFSPDRRVTLLFLTAMLGSFLLLRGVALLIMIATRRLPHSRRLTGRLALANIGRPGAPTPSIVLSLGLGLTLLVALTLIDGNLHDALEHGVPRQAPSLFFIGIQHNEAAAFEQFLHKEAPNGKVELVPMLRGRIVSLNGRPAESVTPTPETAWALQGDRGITFADATPPGSSLVAGAWWPHDYQGPPLVSMEAEIAQGLGLSLGDRLTVNVLGREIEAKIANLRKVNWQNFGINFVLVFSPATFAGAPATDLATLTLPGGVADPQSPLLTRELARQFPGVTSLRVKDALDAINNAVSQLAIAIRGMSAIALLAAILVLSGALAAGQQARLRHAVILKVLGATRSRLLVILLLEYGFLGLATALFGILAGSLAASLIVTKLMHLSFVWIWQRALAAAGVALALTLILGLLGTWRILGQKPAPFLRDL
ncbi:ABC transporter permease [Beijerinckia indica]|uniref:Uncharacterized protein n=1 Tax=Beijerinckia indica subsp. indica (strain ATCC 9039 / DSM 1715 / NCIMB 8712) TaxID=395963 RepID=B2IH66_BEII9|nr:FtsX-like permease family protein [Beijerinckia indica]ACB94479.1 protein of unknown function DUF214 [Beijerinckia indica subsp. indica ATCC 9039]